MNDSLRRSSSSCTYENQMREREHKSHVLTQVINLIKQSSHSSISLSKYMTWKTSPHCCLTEALTQRLEKSRRNVKLRLTAVSSSSFCLSYIRRSFLGKHALFSVSRLPACVLSSVCSFISQGSVTDAESAGQSRGLMQANQAKRSSIWRSASIQLIFISRSLCCKYVQPYCKQHMPLCVNTSRCHAPLLRWWWWCHAEKTLPRSNPSQFMRRNVFDSLTHEWFFRSWVCDTPEICRDDAIDFQSFLKKQ